MGAHRIREDLEGSVHVSDDLGRRVVLTAGNEVPDGYTVGDHLLEESKAKQPKASTQPSADQELVAGNVGDVVGRVGDDPEKAVAVLQAEHAVAKAEGREPRKGVVEPLQKLIDASAGS